MINVMCTEFKVNTCLDVFSHSIADFPALVSHYRQDLFNEGVVWDADVWEEVLLVPERLGVV